MNFFDKIVIPPSANHVLLLKYIMTISLLLFIPYLGMVMGASFISVFFNKKALKTGNHMYQVFAKDVIEKLTFSKQAVFALGVIPLLSILFCYAQFLYQSGTNFLTYILFSVNIFIIAFIHIYIYRNSFIEVNILSSLEESVKDNSAVESKPEMQEVHKLSAYLRLTSRNAGFWGTLILFFGVFFFIASTSIASDPQYWTGTKNIFEVMLTWDAVFGFLYFLSAAGAISGSAILFYFFKWPALSGKQPGNTNISKEYFSFVKKFAITLTFISVLLLPLLLFGNFMFRSSLALSTPVFVYLILLLIAVTVLCNLLYLMFKNSEINFASIVFFLVFVIFAFNILKDQLIFANALKPQTEILIAKSDEYEKEIKSKLVTTSGVDAEQIYNTKCIACHRFDVKLVGPPYQQTVPKYNGDINALSEFIYNPVKKDPAFPPMPNQGLKKKEAVAMAQWLIDKVSGKK